MRVTPSKNVRIPAPRGRDSTAIAALALALAGCGASVDMAPSSATGAQRATMTVPYTNVREEVRLYPDYGPISASILVEGDTASVEKRPAAPKKGKP